MKLKIQLRILVWLPLFLSVANQAFSQMQRETERQIQLLLQEKNSRTPAQQKISSQLLQASREKRGLKMAAGIDLAPANVEADMNGF